MPDPTSTSAPTDTRSVTQPPYDASAPTASDPFTHSSGSFDPSAAFTHSSGKLPVASDGGHGAAGLDPKTATPGDYLGAIAREQADAYASAVRPDSTALGQQRWETDRAFRTANAFLPLENRPPEAWDDYAALYDAATFGIVWS